MRVQSIETVYGGTTYRSRTEARWALLFDLAKIDFQYEPEGYQLHSGWYVPDFWLHSWECFFEVKPDGVIIEAGHYCQERSLAEDLAMATGHDVLFGIGQPHVLTKLARVPVFGISPSYEWLTGKIPPSTIVEATKARFDTRKQYNSRHGDIGQWEPVGRAVNRAYNNIKKGWRDA